MKRFALLLSAIMIGTPGQSVSAESRGIGDAPHFGAWGFDLSGRDQTVAPGSNFYRFANGTYLDKLEIPADRTDWGSFIALRDLSDSRSRKVVEEAAADSQSTGEEAKVGALYRSFLDEGRVEKLGARPIAPELSAIRNASTREQLAKLMGASTQDFFGTVIGLNIGTDAKRPSRYAVYVGQDGLRLPDRDYYLQPSFAEKMAAYQRYVSAQLTAIQWPHPDAAAAAIVAFESEIAKVSWPKSDERDSEKMYVPLDVPSLEKRAPGFPWRAFLDGAQLPSVNRIIVQDSTAIPKIAAIFASTPVSTLKAWEAFTVVDSASPYLSKSFVDTGFAFRGKALNGQPAQRDRWKRAVSLVGAAMGEAVGRLYVARYFPPESKSQMVQLVGNLKDALRVRLSRLSWMSEPTRQAAMAKLAQFRVKIGYPDKWRDYTKLTVGDDLVANVVASNRFDWDFRRGRLDGPVDKGEWGMFPQTVNAEYSPTENDITFPAAILQPPFFDPNADPAVNYGAIGAVIGHEIIHGFDDEGRQFDGTGALRDWWTSADLAKFSAQTERLGSQYSSYEPLPGAHVNGKLTMGENIADLGGILVALDAYHASLNGKPAPVIDGLTGDQRFFLAFEQVWREKTRDDALRSLLVSDPHSPSAVRGYGTVRNVDAWYDAWNVKPGDPMYIPPDARVHIW